MSFLRGFAELIAAPPGDLVYHLVTLFSLQLVLGMACSYWNRRRRDPVAMRLLVMGIGLALGRALLMLIALLHRAGLVSSAVVLPPLERFVDLCALLVVGWALLPFLRRYSRLGDALTMAAVLGSIVLYALSALLWVEPAGQGMLYSHGWQAAVWELASLSVLTIMLVINLAWRDEHWGGLVCAVCIWFAGQALELAGLRFSQLLIDSQVAGWVRLANLVALPIIASFVYQKVLDASPGPERDVTPDLFSTLAAIQRIQAGRDLGTSLRLVSSATAQAVNADMVAIGLLAPDDGRTLRVLALHPPTGAMLTKQEITLPGAAHPALMMALDSGSLQRAYAFGDEGECVVDGESASGIYAHLGFERSGPLLIQPLVEGNSTLGVILAGNPISQKAWRPRNEQVLRAIGAAVSSSLAVTYRRDTASARTELRRALNEAHSMAQRVASLEARLQEEQQRAEELTAKLRHMEQNQPGCVGGAEETLNWQAQTRAASEVDDLALWKQKVAFLEENQAACEAQLREAQIELDGLRQQAKLVQDVCPAASEGLGGILLSDHQGKIVVASRGAQRLLRCVHPALVGRPLGDLFGEPFWGQVVRRTINGKTDDEQPGAVVFVNLEGEIVQAEIMRLSDGASGLNAVAVMLLSDEKASPQSQIVLSVIEELRTPLTSISGYTELLISEAVGILGEMQRQFLYRVRANAERMSKLLDDLIKMAAIDAGQVALLPEPVNLIEVIESAIVSLAAEFDGRDVTARLSAPTELAPVWA
ncbi:MAG: hypothetical protein GX601_04620, partial [Anaerolineales bacterium]|nr:hypothetical protein [Anaerolineales bacterium]